MDVPTSPIVARCSNVLKESVLTAADAFRVAVPDSSNAPVCARVAIVDSAIPPDPARVANESDFTRADCARVAAESSLMVPAWARTSKDVVRPKAADCARAENPWEWRAAFWARIEVAASTKAPDIAKATNAFSPMMAD